MTPLPLAASELSTILEADTSGLSQPLRLDDSREEFNPPFTDNGRTLKTVASGPLLRAPSDGRSHDTGRRSRETSPFDLSTSMVSSEVMAALSGSDRSQGWLDSVVVEDVVKPRATEHEVPTPDASLNLSALEPDLAAVLNSHQFGDLLPSPVLSPSSTNSRIKSSASSTSVHSQEAGPSSSSQSAPATVRSSPTQSTPARRSSSVARPSLSKPVTSSVPRLARSASERPTARTENSALPSPTHPATSGRTSFTYERPSLQLRRVSPSSETQLPRRPVSGGRESEPRKPAISRLVTPSRHLTSNGVSRIALHPVTSSPSSPGWDADDSSSARAGSAIGSSPSRRSAPPRPSLDDSESTRPQSRLGDSRERSSSLTESTPYHPALVRPTDWLGPRTAKAFAAAGLLDLDKEGSLPSVSRPGSRFGSARSERDMRSQYAPSRMAFSEAGSRASWGRRSGSISRTVASSEIITSESASASTPRTAFSAASTAPTSLSAASTTQKHLQTELQLLQDRHALETGALLNALADSQRTTRLLRDENSQLRDQIQLLEDRLADTLDELRRSQLAPPPKLSRTNFYRSAGGTGDLPRRPLAHSRLQTVLHPEPELEPDQYHALEDNTNSPYDLTPTYEPMPMSSKPSHVKIDSYSDTHKRRHSTSSSIFPIVPSNMSMLLHDDGAPDTMVGRSTRSVSPSPIIPGIPLPGKPSQGPYDTHHRTSSSTGNISPTTANFSMMTGSPGSLCLRPEHERLLGDMPTLDLCAEDYERDAYDDDHGR